MTVMTMNGWTKSQSSLSRLVSGLFIGLCRTGPKHMPPVQKGERLRPMRTSFLALVVIILFLYNKRTLKRKVIEMVQSYESVIESIREEILEKLLEDERFINLVRSSMEQRWDGIMNADNRDSAVEEELICMEQILVGKTILNGIFGS